VRQKNRQKRREVLYKKKVVGHPSHSVSHSSLPFSVSVVGIKKAADLAKDVQSGQMLRSKPPNEDKG